MLIIWLMLGLTAIAVVVLILSFRIFKKTKAERLHLQAKVSAGKEELFQKNCAGYMLSSREIEVLRLILEGHTYKSAAEILFISEKTVDAHLRRIYAKSGVKNKVELVVKFYS